MTPDLAFLLRHPISRIERTDLRPPTIHHYPFTSCPARF
jgi:hypothetical protein